MKKMFKKAISVFLVVAMFLCAAPLGGFVGLDLPNILEFEAEAGDYHIDSSGSYRLEVSDTQKCATILEFNSSINGDVVIPSIIDGYLIVSIFNGAFENCDNLTGVTIPNSVTSIGFRAFAFCDKLARVIIPDSVTEIEMDAFLDCKRLTDITLPRSITRISSQMFRGCSSLTNIIIPNNIASIGSYAFYGCYNLTNLIIPESVTSIGACAFDACYKLQYVHIPKSATDISGMISGYAFESIICSDTEDCYAKTYADSYGIEFKVCNGYHSTDNPNDKPTDTPTNKTYKFYNREYKHNLDYFAKNGDSSKYDPELANLLAALSAAAYDEETIKNAYKELGFDDCETFNYDGVTLGKVAYSLAFKKSDNSDETICLVTVRGTVNNSEWFGNANISTTNGKHDGFLNATNQIYDNVQNYIDSNNITGDVKYFVTGHSRGAAVGNLLSVGLMENGVASSNVYNYNYACPDVATHAVFPDYNNIFNVCNTADIVSHVPGEIANSPESDSHWGKYGRTHWFTMDIPDTGDILQDIKNDHNVDFYLKYMDQQLDPSEWWYIAPTDNGVIGHTASIQCPVDVVITDGSDKNIASVINGEINYYDSAFGDVIILTDGDKKFIYINGDNDFNINLVGTDNGKMTYSIEKYNIFTKETLESKTFENVTLEKGKEMYSPIIGNESTDEVKLYVVDDGDITHRITEDGTEIDYSWVNEYAFEMKSPSTTTVKYGDTLVLQADLGETALPEGWSIKWDVDGAGFNMTPVGDGLTCNMTSVANGNATVKATLVDETGEVVLNAEGNEISAEITLKSNASFWQKIVSFFKNLFRINRIIY